MGIKRALNPVQHLFASPKVEIDIAVSSTDKVASRERGGWHRRAATSRRQPVMRLELATLNWVWLEAFRGELEMLTPAEAEALYYLDHQQPLTDTSTQLRTKPRAHQAPGDLMSPSSNKVLLLIGASRGLGCAIAKEYISRSSNVLATVRGPARTPLHDLAERASGQLKIEHVDITVPAEISALRDRLDTQRFDLMFVNAGVTNREEETVAASAPTSSAG